jgi:tRNA nucleotidyltransferase (CCA-adding enzyme)
MDEVLKKVLKRITPSDSERKSFLQVLDTILKAADDVIIPLGLEKTLAGSFIRDTWLPDKREMDLFIMIPVSHSREELEKIGLEVGKKIMKKVGGNHAIAYAEHPYVKGEYKGFSIDIVPCYKVESASKIKSAVDRTPFHNKYILRHLEQKMAGDVRLLKQFCKAIDVYGSDIRTLGFSGYLCELLVIKYKNFKRLVRSAVNWKLGKCIDLEGHCNRISSSGRFKDQPLIVIDPTDPNRNVAASLSSENFLKFINACALFLRKPALSFFEIKRIPIKKREYDLHLKKRKTEIVLIEFERPNVVDDILWSQMRKTSARLGKLLADNEFRVHNQDVWSDEKNSYIVLEMPASSLPELIRLNGPPVSSEKHSREFIEKYKRRNVFQENGRWSVEVKRKYRNAEELLGNFLHKPVKMLLKDGVRSYVAKGVAKRFRVLKKTDTIKLIDENHEFAVFMKKYFERRA